MTRKLLFGIISLSISVSVFAQTLGDVRSNFESFEYRKVIELSNNILSRDTSLAPEDRIDLLTMKGVSFYSVADTDSSRAAFIDLLKLSPEHELDPVRISPKIISFYNSVKSEFEEISEAVTNPSVPEELPEQITLFNNQLYTKSIVRSIMIPGLGHLYADNSIKNWILTGVSTANLGAMVFYIIETNNREKKYLNETNVSNIGRKYDSYNEAYRIRNILIGTYAALWLYSQIDLLFNSEDLFVYRIQPGLSIRPSNGSTQFCLDFRFSF